MHRFAMLRLLLVVLLAAACLGRSVSGRACQRSDVVLQSYHIHVLFPPSNAQATNAAMDLVFFEDAMKHISRVARIISNSSGLGFSRRSHRISIRSRFGGFEIDTQY